MDVRYPQVLWAFAGIAAFALLMLRLLAGRRTALTRFAEAGLIDRLLEGLDRRRRRLRLVLRCVTLALLVVAVAGPRWGFRWEEVRREGIDLMVALDTSRSMLATDVAPNRLERAKLAVMDLVGRLDGDRVGLVAFAGTAFLECPLTLDYSAFERTLRALHTGIIPRGGTSLSHAIDTVLKSFDARQGKYQALVLITDGEDHEGDVEAAAERAAKAGVKIFTVGIGTTEGELLPADDASGFFKDRQGNVVKSRLDENTLNAIAQKSGGAYVRGLGASLGLDEVFRDHIATMERRDVGSRLERRGEDRFQFPLAVAIVFFLMESLLTDRRGASVFARARGVLGRRVTAMALAFLLVGLATSARAAPDPAVEGYRLYAEGQYDHAAERWREALIDEPDSPLLRYNLGTALFRDSKFDEAAEAFGHVAASADPQWKEKAAYNWGNSLYRVGQNAETAQPESAVKNWEQALEAYRLAMAADPADKDPKLGYEFVSGRLRALRDKLEKEKEQQKEQQKEQKQQDQQQPQQQQPQGQSQQEQDTPDPQQQQSQPQSQPQDEQGQQGGEKSESQSKPQDEQSSSQAKARHEKNADQEDTEQKAARQEQEKAAQAEAADDAKKDAQQQAAGAENPQAGDKKNDGSPDSAVAGDEQAPADQRAARAVLDAVRREELGPDDVDRSLGAAVVADPTKDW
jgi:Ca-activated chloride channel family protein